jgi:hypothetical protein
MIPLEWVVMRWAAQNHAVSGSLERCIVVPAVTEVCRPHRRTTRRAFVGGAAVYGADRYYGGACGYYAYSA